MPIGPTRTKAQKQQVMHTEMHKFKAGNLHSGSKQGPVVKNRAQAVAIGLSESKQGKAGGKDTPHHSQRHSPGGPANNDGYVPALKGNPNKQGFAPHAGAKPIGVGFAEHRHTPNQSYAAEQREHWGSKAEGHPMAKKKEFGNVGTESRGSTLIGQEGHCHDTQTHGKATGEHDSSKGAHHHQGHSMGGEPHQFRPPAASNAHGYRHEGGLKQGALRLSGHSGAHQIGKKK